MFTKDQLEDKLKTTAKSAIFERDFALAFDKYIAEKRNNSNKTYAEKKDWSVYTLNPSNERQIVDFTVQGDDAKLHQAKWKSFLKDSAFYLDQPTLQEQREMKFKLQHRYDNLFADAWQAPLQSRKNLLTWTCEKRNEYLAEREAPEGLIEDCKNYTALLRNHGPNYEPLKAKLGYVRGLFD